MSQTLTVRAQYDNNDMRKVAFCNVYTRDRAHTWTPRKTNDLTV